MPAGLDPIREILDFAMAKEDEAYHFYVKLSRRTHDSGMKKMFLEFAEAEEKHREKLQKVAEEEAGEFAKAAKSRKVPDLRISDYLVDVDPLAEQNYQSALILAMKREKASFRLYTDFAERTKGKELSDLFLALAQEEAKHKLSIEIEYDEFLKEN